LGITRNVLKGGECRLLEILGGLVHVVFQELDCMEDLMWLLRVGFWEVFSSAVVEDSCGALSRVFPPRPFVRFRVSSPSLCQGI